MMRNERIITKMMIIVIYLQALPQNYFNHFSLILLAMDLILEIYFASNSLLFAKSLANVID